MDASHYRIRFTLVATVAAAIGAIACNRGDSRGPVDVPSDSVLTARFTERQPVFDSIVRTFRKRAQMTAIDLDSPVAIEMRDGRPVTPNRNAILRELLSHARSERAFTDARYASCVFVRIHDTTATVHTGFVFAPEGCTIPRSAPDNVLRVHHISGDWFIYRARPK